MYVASDHPPRGTACAPRGRGSPDLAMRSPAGRHGWADGPHAQRLGAPRGSLAAELLEQRPVWRDREVERRDVHDQLDAAVPRSVAPPAIPRAPGSTGRRKRTLPSCPVATTTWRV